MNLLKFITNLHIRRYSKKMYKAFPFVEDAELAYINDYIGQVEEFLDDYPRSSYKDIVDCIGSPEDAVQSYIENLDYKYLKPKLDIIGNILRVLNCIVWITVIFFIFRTNMIYQDHMRTIDSYHPTIENVIEEDEIIEEDIDDETSNRYLASFLSYF